MQTLAQFVWLINSERSDSADAPNLPVKLAVAVTDRVIGLSVTVLVVVVLGVALNDVATS